MYELSHGPLITRVSFYSYIRRHSDVEKVILHWYSTYNIHLPWT